MREASTGVVEREELLMVLGKYQVACKYWWEIVAVIDDNCILIAKARRASSANENTEIPAGVSKFIASTRK